jgi:hypothetical protein
MFKIKKPNIYQLEQADDLYGNNSGVDFNVAKYISKTYKSTASYLHLEQKFKDEVLKFLFKNGQIISFNVDAEIKELKKDFNNFKSASFWFKYKNIYIRLSSENSSDGVLKEYLSNSYSGNIVKEAEIKRYKLTMVAPTCVQDFPYNDFEKFAVEPDECRIHLFIKNEYNEYNFEPLKVQKPEIDLELNYGKSFLKVDEIIQSRLKSINKGLFMFHGCPGTGKTTYIKYLASKINRDFIFVPTTMIETFTSDPNCLQYLIQKPNSVLILEDAEKAVVKRHGDNLDSSTISSLLNLTDGILSDILQISVIVTYNCAKNQIDNALKRKGRLQADYEFGLLGVDDAKKLAESLKYNSDAINSIESPMSLADVYNLGKDVEFKNVLVESENSERIVGFGK